MSRPGSATAARTTPPAKARRRTTGPRKEALELARDDRNLISDLYTFRIRHQTRCRRCMRNKASGECATLQAAYALEAQLYEDLKLYEKEHAKPWL